MSEAIAIQCPHCKKRFKGKGDVAGKKIRCPLCTEPFTVEGAKPSPIKAGAAPARSAPAKSAAIQPAPKKQVETIAFADEEPKPPAPPPPDDRYGLTELDETIRCPNCTKPMPNAEANICLYCGYNTLTREQGKTLKTYGVSGQQLLAHLAPGLASFAFFLTLLIAELYYCLVVPNNLHNSWWSWLDHESLRMWSMMITLGLLWASGSYCVQRLIMNPIPKEVKKE